VLWNLWFFSFWSVSIVADAAHSSFGRSALIAAFNAGAGILGFPIGGWLSDVSVRHGIGRKRLVLLFTALQCALTVASGLRSAAVARRRSGYSLACCSARARSSTRCSRSRTR
jgi:MFS transporter, ACS family, D-galactonate transporter